MNKYIKFDRDDIVEVPVVSYGLVAASSKEVLQRYLQTCNGRIRTGDKFALTAEDLEYIYEDDSDDGYADELSGIRAELGAEAFDREMKAFTERNLALVQKYNIKYTRWAAEEDEEDDWGDIVTKISCEYTFTGRVPDLEKFASEYEPYLGDYDPETESLSNKDVYARLDSGDQNLIDFCGNHSLTNYHTFNVPSIINPSRLQTHLVYNFDGKLFTHQTRLDKYIQTCMCRYNVPENIPFSKLDCFGCADYDTLLDAYDLNSKQLSDDLNSFNSNMSSALSKYKVKAIRKKNGSSFSYALEGTFENLTTFISEYQCNIKGLEVPKDWFDENNLLIDPDSGEDYLYEK